MAPRAPLLHAGPAVGFDRPFELLLACHERVQQRLDLLARLAEHLDRHGADAQAQGAAQDVLRYFDRAAPHHHDDEERHVLPRLRALGHGALADALAADHVQMHAGWQRVREPLVRVANGEAADLGPWRDWAALYAAHIAREENEAFGAAAQGLSPEAEQAMGAEMAARRQRP